MRIVVVGASSGTGRLVAQLALARGGEVVAVSRRGCDVAGVTQLRGDASRAEVCEAALAGGADAVVVTVGGTDDNPANRTDVTRSILARMAARSRAPRLIVQSSLGAGDSARFLPGPVRLLATTVLRAALADHTSQEELVRDSGLRWTIVRPGGLTDKPATGRVMALEEPGKLSRTIPRADVAAFILDCVDDEGAVGHAFALGTA